jgi:hypothetical protein
MTGTVTFDLRLLGVGRGIAPRSRTGCFAGAAGFALSVLTGTLFIAGKYAGAVFLQRAFWGGSLFPHRLQRDPVHSLEFKRVVRNGSDDDAPLAAKWMARRLLVLLTCVMCAGRMLTFFRPF